MKKFYFFYENVIMTGNSSEEKALSLPEHLDGSVFDFGYDSFAAQREQIDGAKNYAVFKVNFSDISPRMKSPPRYHLSSIGNWFQDRGHTELLGEIEPVARGGQFRKYCKIRLRTVTCRNGQLQQFLSFLEPNSYGDIVKALKNFQVNRIAFPGSSPNFMKVPPSRP